jgi:hypothetical protein
MSTANKMSFDEISRNVWQQMGQGNPFAPPPPQCGPFVNDFYGNNNLEGIDFKSLINFLMKFPSDNTLYLDWNQYAKGAKPFPSPFRTLSPARRHIYIPDNIHYEYINDEGKVKTIVLSGRINKRNCYLSNDYGYTILIDAADEEISLSLSYYFQGTEDKRRDAKDTQETGDFRIEDQYRGVELTTESFDDLGVIVKSLHGESHFNGYVKMITEKLAAKINAATDVDEINFLYKKLPDFSVPLLSKYVMYDKALGHLELLCQMDEDSIWDDSSKAVIKLMRTLDMKLLYALLRDKPGIVKRIFDNLDKTSVIDGQEMSNKTIFASLMHALCMYNKYEGLSRTGKIFYLGDGYEWDSNAFFPEDQEIKDNTFYIKQKKFETTYSGPSYSFSSPTTNAPVSSGGGYSTTEVKNFDPGPYYYKPFDLVYVIDTKSADKIPMLVPAIYVKTIAHETEIAEVMRVIRIGADILALIIGIASLGTASPLLLAFAVLDIGIAAGDLAVMANEDELMKTDDGKAFLANWNKIALIGGIVTAGPLLINGTFRLGARLLAKVTVEGTKKFLQTCLLKILLEVNISNFAKNTLKVLDPLEVAATPGLKILSREAVNLYDAGLIFVKGAGEGGKESSEVFAVIYKTEVIAEGSAQVIQKKFKDLIRLSGAKLIENLDIAIRYAKKYPVNKLRPLITAGEAAKEFGELGRKLVNSVDNEVDVLLKTLSKNKINDNVMVSGMAYTKNGVHEVFTATNFLRKELKKGADEVFQNFVNNLHITLKKRLTAHLQKLEQKGVQASISDIERAGKAGSHGEIRALDKLLKKVDPMGELGEAVFDGITGYNRFLREGANAIQPPCVHCYYITNGIKFIGF